MSHRSYAESPRRVTRSRGIPCGEGETEILFKSGTGRRSNAKQPAVSRQIDTKFRAPRGCLAVSQPLPVSPAKAGPQPLLVSPAEAGAQPCPAHRVHIPGSRVSRCSPGKTVAALFAREGRTPAPSRIPRESGGPAKPNSSRSHPWIPGLAMLAREDGSRSLCARRSDPSPFPYPPRKRGPSQTQLISFTSLDPGSRDARPGRRVAATRHSLAPP